MMEYTYLKQLGSRNIQGRPITEGNAERVGRPDIAGEVHEWATKWTKKGSLPAMVPDQWLDDVQGWPLAPLPSGIRATFIEPSFDRDHGVFYQRVVTTK